MLFHDAAGRTAAWENCNAGCNKMAGSAFGMLFDVTPLRCQSDEMDTHAHLETRNGGANRTERCVI